MKLVSIVTTDGETLEARVSQPTNIRAAVVVAHPHPLMGGTFDSPVIVALQQALERDNIVALCPNFRGAGRSTGTHDNGIAERLDLLASLEWLMGQNPDVSLHLAGYSFGGRSALGVDHPAIRSWSTIAPALVNAPGAEQRELIGADPRPKLVVVGSNDTIVAPDQLAPLVAHWTATTMDIITGADHFWAGQLPTVVNRIVGHINEHIAG
jgi:uncharacterized protein